MNEKVKLSIIIPYYNAYDYIEQLLVTIPNNDDIEVIVIDDHSDKETKKYETIKEQYSNKNIIFLDNKPNWKNAGMARNAGLEYATGDWILFADADDWMTEDFYDIVKKYFDSNYEIVYFLPSSKKDNGEKGTRHVRYEKIAKEYLVNKSEKSIWELKSQWDVPFSKMIKRDLINNNAILFDDVRYSNDVMFSLKTGLKSKRIYVADKTIYCIREHSTGLTKESGKDVHEVRTKINLKKYRYLMNYIPYKYRKEIFKKSRIDEIKILKDYIKYCILNIEIKS